MKQKRSITSTFYILCFGFIFVATPALASSWYVDGRDGGRYNTGSAASPFLYLWQALQKVGPGDTIYMVPSVTYPQLGFTAEGTAAAPITMAGSDPSRPTKVSGMGIHSAIWVNGDYLKVRNFDATAPGKYVAISLAPNKHHITVASNIIHDAGLNGINTIANDYVTASHNIVYGNAHITEDAFGSGISFLGSVDIDSNRGVKMIIDGNIIYDNTNVPDCSTSQCLAAAAGDSDGSGIIIDNNIRDGIDDIPYRGAFLITNNVIYRNGGRGVHVYKSDNVTITGNTMYYNNQDPYEAFWHPGEVSVIKAGNVSVFDNILQSDGLNSVNRSGTAPNYHVCVSITQNTDGRGPLVARDNLCYNPQKDYSHLTFVEKNTNPVSVGPNIFAGARLRKPSDGDFRFNPDSPAYHAGDPDTSPSVDILGVSRGSLPSIGAYQNPAP